MEDQQKGRRSSVKGVLSFDGDVTAPGLSVAKQTRCRSEIRAEGLRCWHCNFQKRRLAQSPVSPIAYKAYWLLLFSSITVTAGMSTRI